MTLPTYVSRAKVQERLLEIFTEGSPARNYCTREVAAATVFSMLYIGAIEGTTVFLAPKHVYRMSDKQAAAQTDAERSAFSAEAQKAGFQPTGKAWYADTTREPIRDETLRNGLMVVGAATARKDLSTNSSKPRYALTAEFAALFDPALTGGALEKAIFQWRKKYLSASAQARMAILSSGAVGDESGVGVEFPNGETRRLASGPSSIITKAVIEEFAPRFLVNPAVLWLSESGNKVVARDDLLAKKIKIKIDAAKNLPDVILVDVGRESFLLVFVEVVATDGPINDLRREALLALATEAGLGRESVAFVTAFLDRDHGAFKKCFGSLAWDSFAWLASEPQRIVALLDLEDVASAKLHDLLALGRGTS